LIDSFLLKGEYTLPYSIPTAYLITYMLQHIQVPNDVIAFARELVKENLNFHPDDDFTSYLNIETQKPTFTKEEAELRNALMRECVSVCEKHGVDIYDIVTHTTLKETGMDKFVPLPAAQFM
jgi:hypothetical protein